MILIPLWGGWIRWDAGTSRTQISGSRPSFESRGRTLQHPGITPWRSSAGLTPNSDCCGSDQLIQQRSVPMQLLWQALEANPGPKKRASCRSGMLVTNMGQHGAKHLVSGTHPSLSRRKPSVRGSYSSFVRGSHASLFVLGKSCLKELVDMVGALG